MKRQISKRKAIILTVSSYLTAAVIIALGAVFVPVIRQAASKGEIIDMTTAKAFCVYVPLVVAAFSVAALVRVLIGLRYDLSVIGMRESKSGAAIVFGATAVAGAALFFGFVLSTQSIKGDRIFETGLFGSGESVTVISASANYEYSYNDRTYTLHLRSGKDVIIKKDSKAGEELEKVLA